MILENIAACGINCSVCSAFLRKKNNCPGCNSTDNKPTYCKTCIIKMCEDKKSEKIFCGLCDRYPCVRLKTLHKRYNQKYGVNIFENLEMLNTGREKEFLLKEEEKWKCRNCGNTLCMHKSKCMHCEAVNPNYIGTRT